MAHPDFLKNTFEALLGLERKIKILVDPGMPGVSLPAHLMSSGNLVTLVLVQKSTRPPIHTSQESLQTQLHFGSLGWVRVEIPWLAIVTMGLVEPGASSPPPPPARKLQLSVVDGGCETTPRRFGHLELLPALAS